TGARHGYIAVYNPATESGTRLPLVRFNPSDDLKDGTGLSVLGLDVVISAANEHEIFVYVVNHRPPLGDAWVWGPDTAVEIFKGEAGGRSLSMSLLCATRSLALRVTFWARRTAKASTSPTSLGLWAASPRKDYGGSMTDARPADNALILNGMIPMAAADWITRPLTRTGLSTLQVFSTNLLYLARTSAYYVTYTAAVERFGLVVIELPRIKRKVLQPPVENEAVCMFDTGF
ncbi:hypothetical protein AURDEDRAFT_177009, partial [Auricularia subglabra TFB-10046 SS5]